MNRRVRVLRVEREVEGKKTLTLVVGPDNEPIERYKDHELFENLGTIELLGDEVWRERYAALGGGTKALTLDADENVEDAPRTLEEIAVMLVKSPLVSEFELYSGRSRYKRNIEGKPIEIERLFWTTKEKESELPDDEELEFSQTIEYEPKEVEKLKGALFRDIHHRGFHIAEIEHEIKEDPDTIYFFTEKASVQQKKGQPEKYFVRCCFTKDVFGANVPVWFIKSAQTGGYPERVQEQGWDLAAIRRELETKPYVIGELVVGVNPAEVEREMARRGGPKEADAAARDEAIESALSNLYSKLK